VYEYGKTRAVQYLESQLTVARSDSYALSIVCYALTLANSTFASQALQTLNELAVKKG
jgi:hypothetical protein